MARAEGDLGATCPSAYATAMRFGFRRPSIRKRIAARTSLKRYVRHSLGIKAPRGFGWLTNPRRAAYNRVYNRTTRPVGCLVLLGAGVVLGAGVAAGIYGFFRLCAV